TRIRSPSSAGTESLRWIDRSYGCLRAEQGRDLAGQDAAVAVGEGDLGIFYLALPAFSAQLSHRLDDREDAVHAGMHARKAAAVGVHGQAAARSDAAAGNEC